MLFIFKLTLVLSIFAQDGLGPQDPYLDLSKIRIHTNGLVTNLYRTPRVNAGPATGDMLNNHFFYGIDLYNAGHYSYAQPEFAYVARHPEYLVDNPRRNEFMSTSNYLLGMIYMYHADGTGRRNVARAYFERAIEWNPNNYTAYLELARVFRELRFPKQAGAIIQRLLDLKPPEVIAAQARAELNKLPASD